MANRSQNPASEVSRAIDGDGQDAKGKATDDFPEKSVLAITEPIREDQVQNAVKFLEHPKVRGSPVIHRHAFLEKKGLTKEEIDEAFRRVPDPPSNVVTVEDTTASQAIPPKSSTTLQPQVPYQVSQQPPAVSSATTSMHHSKFNWSQALFVVGIASALGAGTAVLFKKKIIPKLKAWIQKVVAEENDFKLNIKSKANIAEEAAEAAKAAASAAAAVAVASQELLNAKNADRKYFEAFSRMLDVQLEEMISIGNAIHKMETTRKEFAENKGRQRYTQSELWKGTTNNPWRSTQLNQSSFNFSSDSKLSKVNGSLNEDIGIVKQSPSLSSTEVTEPTKAPPHPKSYMEILEMIQRGEKPPNIKDIDDNPPNPDQPITKPLLAPRPKPWEVGQQVQQRSTYDLCSQANGQGLNSEAHDINSQLNGLGLNSEAHDINSQLNGIRSNGSEPWWRKKTINISEMESESEEFFDAMRANSSPMKQGWVPPQPPAVLMPEAADAIRQPRSSIQKQHSDNNNMIVSSSNGELDVKASDWIVQHERSGSTGMDLN